MRAVALSANKKGRITKMLEPLEPVRYHVYRSEDPTLPKDQWTRVTDEPILETHYKEKGLKPGVMYYYYVTAVHPGGIESGPSEVSSARAGHANQRPDTIEE
jgi:hypothetical protein